MSRILRNPENPPDEPHLRFTVYKDPKGSDAVFGYYEYDHPSGDTGWTFGSQPFGIPVNKAFEDTKNVARQKNIPLVVIHDPDDLFPERRHE